ncbi:MAG TPA: branched-chain amino acid aminotransferase [Victivallales bacterium]|nr:branched-chain amino acid aminotransferase [Victivallales bacterium]HRU00827.1 branched-chain amino acid aminotransferase [Victivallales bacterium]
MSAHLDWKKLGFEYIKTRAHVRASWEDGKWGKLKIFKKDYISMSIAATCLHYGQACFEGLKAFSTKDGKVKIFRPDENLKRMNNTADFLHIPRIPEELFFEALLKVIRENLDYIPPYGTGGSLYIRPLLIGSGPTIGVAPSGRYEFIVLVIPVGKYYEDGLKGVKAIILDDFDRAAPKGTGHVKVAGNYAASLHPSIIAKKMGFPIVLYLDSKTHEYIDEFGTSNFVAIDKRGYYVTPDSRTILPSITNKSLSTLAEDLGIKVQRRPIHITELSDFVEVGACGTAVVITPIESITHNEKIWTFPSSTNAVLKKLYDHLIGIQYGEKEDKFGWLFDTGI